MHYFLYSTYRGNPWTTFLIALMVFSILFIGLGNRLLKQETVAYRGEEEGEDAETEESIEEMDEMIFLLMGIDDTDGTGGIMRVREKKIKGEDKHEVTGKRSDTMVLCKYNFETGDITMMSIPRDSRVYIRGRKKEEKIAHAHSYGGPFLAIKTVKDLLNIDLKYYATVDYLAVKKIVDAIKGVDIDVAQRMYYKDPTAKPPLIIDIYPGQQTLNGDKSLEYLRFRDYPNADEGRVKAQQLFMKEFIKQVLRPKNLLALPTMAKTYYDYVDTNIPLSLVAKGALSAKKIDVDNIRTVTLPGQGKYIGKTSYFIYDEDSMREVVSDMFGNFVLKE